MLSVVLADDDYYVREMFKHAIDWNAHGFNIVGEASDSTQAIQLVNRLTPDIILLDINMPGSDGFLVAEEIRRNGKKTKVIIVTGYDTFEFAKRAISFGVCDYLLKPVTDAELLSTVLNVKNTILADEKRDKLIDSLKSNINKLLPFVNAEAIKTLEEHNNNEFDDLEDSCNIVYKAKKYVLEHLNDPELSVESVSRALFVNMTYLSHIFKKEYGKGLHEFILSSRMEKARQIIMSTDMKISGIISEVGFKDATYFGKCFKTYFGVSFSQMRKISKRYGYRLKK